MVAEQRRRALEPAREQVLARRLAERLAELAAEVRGGEMRGTRERGYVQRLAVARVDQVFRAEQVAGGWMGDHRHHEYCEGADTSGGVGLIDLRDRADDAEVQALVALVHSEGGSAGVDESPRLLVGWSEDGKLVGGIGIERLGERELALTNLFVLEELRLRGIGSALVEAVVSGAPVERFRVDCGAEVAGFFERCGFVPDSDGTLVRDIPTEPAPEATAAVTLADLEAAIRASWSQETSADPDEWTVDNASRGQCDATAVVLRSYLGGEILVADILEGGRRIERHAWNRLPSGLTLDLTRDQLRTGQELGPPSVQEPMLLGNSRERHALLAERVAAALAANHS